MTTLKVLEQAINEGLTNSDMSFFANNKKITFMQYLFGDSDAHTITANGAFGLWDKIPAGLFIWEEENFISIADAIFSDGKTKIAYYKL